MVDIRLSKAAAAAGPALGSGVVYRVKDGEIIVAIEDLPEEGLNQPLRLEKLTNEVSCTCIDIPKCVIEGLGLRVKGRCRVEANRV